MTASRLQHTVMASAVLLVAGIVAWLSFTQEPAAAFLFPRLIAVFFVAFAAWNFARAATGLARVGPGVTSALAVRALPGLTVLLVYVFFATDTLGFYVSSTAAFILIYILYDPAPLLDARAGVKRIVVTFGFMGVIYGLFDLLLKVHTPRGLFF